METETMSQIITKDQLLKHWQGHRNLSRRTLEKFPEKELFEFSIGGMRTFADLVKEMLAIAAPSAKGLETGNWEPLEEEKKDLMTKGDLLKAWDEATDQINSSWPNIPMEVFQQRVVAFGQYESSGYELVAYAIENEVHHRGQGYVYLRSLGIEPPFFWERE